jgi:hypothetical protein
VGRARHAQRRLGSGSSELAGTDGNRFRNNQPDFNYQPTSNGGNMRVTYAGPISFFSFIYRNQAEEGGSNQLISISDISFAC